MLKKILIFFIGLLIGVFGMSCSVYYLEYHYAMSLLPWILGTSGLILVLMAVIAFLLQRRKLNKLQKQTQKEPAWTPAPASAEPAPEPAPAETITHAAADAQTLRTDDPSTDVNTEEDADLLDAYSTPRK